MLPRLYLPGPLAPGARVALPPAQAHYVQHVLRLKPGGRLALFNGQDGEYLAVLREAHKQSVIAEALEQSAPQRASPDIWLAFAPIKHGRIEALVEKATELGVSTLWPVFTRHTIVTRLNEARLHAHAVEAAEQSERLDIPAWHPPCDLPRLLADWPKDRLLLYGDESGASPAIHALLAGLPRQPLGLLIGPEGGFARDEHALLKAQPFARGVCLGPRILRADTAAAAALACIQSTHGDWQEKPRFQPH